MPIGIAVLYFCFVTYVNIVDPPLYDEYPKKSAKNEFMLLNDGCCFVLEDFSISLSDENGTEYLLFSHASPTYGKRLIANFPQDIFGSVQVIVSFYYEYVTSGYVEFPIMDFESLDTLKKNGLLLIFGDGDLKVQSGRQEAFFSYDKVPWADNLSVTKYSDITDRYYEETSNGYKAAIYTKEEIEVEKIESWLASCKPSDKYNQYIYSDPDSWDIFIFYSPENTDFIGYSFRFSVDGSVVKIYVTSDSSVDNPQDYLLIRIQAPLRGAWPNSSELYIDGNKIDITDNK